MIALILALASGQVVLKDEGASLGQINVLNCVGAGVDCTRSGTTGTVTASGGGGSYTLPAATATVLGGVKGTGSALVCSGTDKATGFAADGTLQCAADSSGTGTVTSSGTPASTYIARFTTATDITGDATATLGNGVMTLTPTGGAEATLFLGGNSGRVRSVTNELILGYQTRNDIIFNSSGYALQAPAGGPNVLTVGLVDSRATFGGVVIAASGVQGNASTATALAADPAACAAGSYGNDTTAAGALVCAVVQYSQLGGTVPTWNQNTTGAAANVTSPISIANGGTTETASTEDAVLVGASTTDWAPKVLPSCSNATTSKLLYDSTANAFSCGTDQTGGAGAASSVEVSVAITAAGVFEASVAATWVAADTEIVCRPFATTADGLTVETYDLADLRPTASARSTGVGFTLRVFSPNGATGTYRFHCLGV